MRARFTGLLLALMLLTPLFGQVSVEKLFQTMPDNLIWLNKTDRMELFAYYLEKKVDSIRNSMGGYSKMIDYDEAAKHLAVRTSLKGSMELQLIDTEPVSVIGVILTACGSACNSDIRFFTTGWNPMEMKLPPLSPSDFLKTTLSEEDMAIGQQLLTPLFVSYAFKKGTKEIVAQCNSAAFQSGDAEKIKSLMNDKPLTLAFENGSWKIKRQ